MDFGAYCDVFSRNDRKKEVNGLMKKSLIALFCGIFLIAVGILIPVISVLIIGSAGGSVGIIGGADGPSAIYLSSQLLSGFPFVLILFGTAIVLSSLFCLIFRKTVKEHCSIKTSILSLALSAVGALGMFCFIEWLIIVGWNSMKFYPIVYYASIIIGIISLITAILLLVLYITERKKQPSVKGIIIDVLLMLLYFMAFFTGYGSLLSFLRN